MRWLFIAVVAINVLFFIASWLERREVVTVAGDEHLASFSKSLDFARPAVAPGLTSESLPRGAGLCPAVGPVDSEGEAARVRDVLLAAGYEAKVMETSSRRSVYWVYVPSLDGRSQALRRLREMHVAGIDSFIVASGADQNAISVGLYSNKDSALGVQTRLNASGYSVQVREQGRSSNAYWVVLSAGAQGFVEFLGAELRGRAGGYRECVPH